MCLLHPVQHSLGALGFRLSFEGKRKFVHHGRESFGRRAATKFRECRFQPAGRQKVRTALQSVGRVLSAASGQPPAQSSATNKYENWPAEVQLDAAYDQEQEFDDDQANDCRNPNEQDFAPSAARQKQHRDDGEQGGRQPFESAHPCGGNDRLMVFDIGEQ